MVVLATAAMKTLLHFAKKDGRLKEEAQRVIRKYRANKQDISVQQLQDIAGNRHDADFGMSMNVSFAGVSLNERSAGAVISAGPVFTSDVTTLYSDSN